MREMKKLGELGDIFIGLTYKPEDVVDEDGIIVLRSSNIQDGKLDFGDIVRVSCNVRDKLWVKENDILMCSRNGSAKLVGKTALISNLQEDMTFGAFMTIIRTPYNGYLQYFFKSPMFRRQLNSSATTTINQITRSMLDNIDVPVLDNDTADNIKAILGKCEKIIQERKAEIDALDDLIKARFVELFGDPICNPMEWTVKKLGDLSLQINSGNTPKGGEQVYVDEGITFFRSQNVWKDRLEMDDIAYIDEATHASMIRSSLKHGDILMTKTGRINTEKSSLGRAALYMGEDDAANVNGHVYFIRLRTGVNNKFVLRILVSDEYRDYIRSVCVGGIDKRQLNKDHIENFPIICPPESMIEEYIKFVEQVDKSKFAVQKYSFG